MGRIRNVFNKLADRVEMDRNLKGRIMSHIIVSIAFEDGGMHTMYPDDKLKTAQMLQEMVQERGLHCLLRK